MTKMNKLSREIENLFVCLNCGFSHISRLEQSQQETKFNWNPSAKIRNEFRVRKNFGNVPSRYMTLRCLLSSLVGFSSANEAHALPSPDEALDMGRSGPTAESRESHSGQEDRIARRFGDELSGGGESNSGSRGLIAKGSVSNQNTSAPPTKKKNRLSLSYFKRESSSKEIDFDQLIANHNMCGKCFCVCFVDS